MDERVSDIIAADLGGLPENAASSIRGDGGRNTVHPADVRGRWTRVRRIGFVVLIAIYAMLPWIQINGHPALFFDIELRKFYIMGGSFNAQDFWLVFFLLSGLGFALVVMTTLFGRIWCGYACPQTVFLEAVYRRIERLIEGPRARRLRRNAGPWNWDKVWRKSLLQLLYFVCSFTIAHIFLSYFVSLPAVFKMVREHPTHHPYAFVWAMGITAALHFNFAWFREQFCVIMCPYGRLQSVLTDERQLSRRIRPFTWRASRKSIRAGNGGLHRLQTLHCPCVQQVSIFAMASSWIASGCAACIDACNEIMTRIGRPKGLVRYDSLAGLAGAARRIWRPRLAVYLVLGLVGTAALAFALSRHEPYESEPCSNDRYATLCC